MSSRTTKCRACDGLVSATAVFCPHCGQRAPGDLKTEMSIWLDRWLARAGRLAAVLTALLLIYLFLWADRLAEFLAAIQQ